MALTCPIFHLTIAKWMNISMYFRHEKMTIREYLSLNVYRYTFLGDNLRYPQVKSIRYPKAQATNPNVTVNVIDLSVLKYINRVQIQPPITTNNSYVGDMIWVSPTDLSITFTNREQTQAVTVLCRAPSFTCREIHTEAIVDDGWVLPADKPIFSKTNTYFKHTNQSWDNKDSADLHTHEFKSGGFMLKRLPVRDGEHGNYRHVVFISTSDQRTVPLTMGRFEVTKILGWDEKNEIVYFMAAPELKPGQRHLYKISLNLNVTEKPNRIYVTSTAPVCLTCNNDNFKLRPLNNYVIDNTMNITELTTIVSPNGLELDDAADEDATSIPNNCLYNKIYFSTNYTYYVQECLGPDSPSIYLVETSSNQKVFTLNNGDLLRNRLSQLAVPQMRTIDVEIRHGFHAQVRLFLPPGMKEEEEISFPLILHM